MMHEYELYIPLCDNAGQIISPARIESVKARLRERFGGFTHFPQESEGEWKTGGQMFRDRIVILRVLTEQDADTPKWFRNLKAELIKEFEQTDLLITVRTVEKI